MKVLKFPGSNPESRYGPLKMYRRRSRKLLTGEGGEETNNQPVPPRFVKDLPYGYYHWLNSIKKKVKPLTNLGETG